MYKKYALIFMNLTLVISTVFLACSEAPLLNENTPLELNHPVDIVSIPGSDVALVLNSNINLTQSQASLLVLDTSTDTIVVGQSILLANFGYRLKVDAAQNKIYLSDRENDAIVVFKYTLGANAADFLIEEDVIDANNDILSNAYFFDDEPNDLDFFVDSSSTPYLVYNSSEEGTLMFVNLNNNQADDLFLDDSLLFGLPLSSSNQFEISNRMRPLGVGASEMILDTVIPNFAHIISSQRNYIFTVDLNNREVEHVFSMNHIFPISGSKDLLMDSARNLYFIHQANDSLNKVNMSNVVDNGVQMEEEEIILQESISLPGSPEDLAFNNAETQIWIALYDLNEVWVLDLASLNVLAKIDLDGRGPSHIAFNDTGSKAYVTEFLSDSIAVIDTALLSQVNEIKNN